MWSFHEPKELGSKLFEMQWRLISQRFFSAFPKQDSLFSSSSLLPTFPKRLSNNKTVKRKCNYKISFFFQGLGDHGRLIHPLRQNLNHLKINLTPSLVAMIKNCCYLFKLVLLCHCSASCYRFLYTLGHGFTSVSNWSPRLTSFRVLPISFLLAA